MSPNSEYWNGVDLIGSRLASLQFLAEDDYRNISVYPSSNELVSPSNRQLLPNIIKGPYKSTYEYLNTHFLLLREDFLKPLRENMISLLEGTDQKNLFNIKIHEVTLIRKGMNNGDIAYSFNILRKGKSSQSLNSSKRFMTGSLLVFSKNNFKTSCCGRVVDNSNIVYNKVLVTFPKPVNLRYQEKLIMIECNTFFEPYFHVLNVLQNISHTSLPFKEYLIEARYSVRMPRYLNGMKYTVADPHLNASQLVAMNAALSQELVIIQGPPGTGKTFLGMKIAKELLLRLERSFNEIPLLIVTVTNHALDQFLEGMISSTDKILRYGAQSKNPKMQNYLIGECRRRYYDSHPHARRLKQKTAPICNEYYTIKKEIVELGNRIDIFSSCKSTCIVNFSLLQTCGLGIRNFFGDQINDVLSWLLSGPNLEDLGRMKIIFKNYLSVMPRCSQNCIISVSIMDTAAQQLHDKIKNRTLRKTPEKLEKLTSDYNYLLTKRQYLKICLETDFNNKVNWSQVNEMHPFMIPVRVRWQLYKYWLNAYETHLKEQMDLLINEYKPIYAKFNKIDEKINFEIMKDQTIIGMTTTSAARLHLTIKALKCPIVIVEEAAEVLEAHVIPVLTEHCQHLILLGDHLQLKPSTADYDIETHYKLGVSLFERMVNNNVQYKTLTVQHRMRPEISSLVTPSIYPILYNHRSVEGFPQINGVDKCLYFITHNELEQESGDSTKKNVHEAKFLIKLAEYLLQNRYKPEDITILTPYLGQVGALVQQQSSVNKVKDVKIASVDNFQGEENKIILLSLVRSNSRKKIGFLSIENRVCVALTRAKEGMYIIGNMNQLSSCSRLWRKIKASLKKQNALGTFLPLVCSHGQVTEVRKAEDFDRRAASNGCGQICNKTLSCVHRCQRLCHSYDLLHQCGQICNKTLSCGHRCQRLCHSDDLLHQQYKCRNPCLRVACNICFRECMRKCYEICELCTHPPQLPQRVYYQQNINYPRNNYFPYKAIGTPSFWSRCTIV